MLNVPNGVSLSVESAMNKILDSAGRILWSLPFLMFGIGHFQNATMMAGMVPGYFGPGILWIYLTGACMVLAVVAINFRQKDRLAALLAALLLIIIAVTVQFPNMSSADPNTKMMGFMGFFKDLGLAGGALVIAASSKA
jgi:putative oxidoreductase